jgi:hypothetical protein
MKKIFMLALAALIATAVCAEENAGVGFLGMGAAAPFYNVRVDGDGARMMNGALVDFSYLFTNKNTGFTVRANIAGGAVWTDDIPYYNGDKERGGATLFDVGLGYAFIRTDATVLSLCGDIAYLNYSFTDSADGVTYPNGKSLSDVENIASLWGLGANMSFVKRFAEHLSFYANVGAYYLLGAETLQYSGEHDDVTYALSEARSILGRFMVYPSVGLCWKL